MKIFWHSTSSTAGIAITCFATPKTKLDFICCCENCDDICKNYNYRNNQFNQRLIYSRNARRPNSSKTSILQVQMSLLLFKPLWFHHKLLIHKLIFNSILDCQYYFPPIHTYVIPCVQLNLFACRLQCRYIPR